MTELYNRAQHCGFSEPVWELNEERGKPVRKLYSPSPINSLVVTKQELLINVMKDKERVGISKNTSLQAKYKAMESIK